MYLQNKESIQMARSRDSRAQRGVALVAVMLTLLLVTAIAAGIIILANTETSMSSNFTDEQRAYFSAKGGIEEVRDRLRAGNSYTVTYPTTLPGNGSTGVLYVLNPLNSETVAPWNSSNKYVDDEICNESYSGTSLTCTANSTGKSLPSGSYYTSGTANTTFAPTSGAVLDWKWVRVTLKQNNSFGVGYYVNGSSTVTSQVYWNGNSECLTSSSACTPALPVYVLTALAVTPGGSRRMVQMEAAQDTLNFTAPSALTLDGSGDTFTGANSNNYQVSGNDVGGCGSGASGASVPAVGVPSGDTTDKTSIISEIDTTVNNNTGKESNYYGSGSSTPDVETVNLPSDMSSVAALQQYVSQLKNDVTQPVLNCPSGCTGLSNPGSLPNNPQIIYVNGDLTVTGNTVGGGILVVTGNLTFKGTAEWDGLVMVVGKGNFTMDGTNTFKGAVVVADTLNSSGGTLSVLGGAHGSVSGGGNNNGGIFYSASCLNSGTKLTTYHSVSYRELIQ
jgi:Tfp pilus assembly protein PilX